jgi:predicted naringenin-chalcone synthase
LPQINKIVFKPATHKYSQAEALEYAKTYNQIPADMVGKVSAIYSRSGIANRYSVLDTFSLDTSPVKRPHEFGISERMSLYMQHAMPYAIQTVKDLNTDVKEYTHLITVSCTGMSAPGIDVLLMQQMGMQANITRTSVNFMGCYALVHALKLAHAYCKTQANAKVLIVAIELCSLHWQDGYSMEQIASTMLFADGCVALSISNEVSKGGLELASFYSEVHGNSLSDMSWNIAETGFLMTLSAYVPDILAENIEGLLQNALTNLGIEKNQIKHWAIHPGGKKIVSEIQKALQLQDEDTTISKSVLNDYGNMSSVTLGVVLLRMMEKVNTDEYIFGTAFGPGLTMESLLLKVN